MEKNEIVEFIIEKYKLQKGQYIDYDFFMLLYQECNNKMTEYEFAKMLGMTKWKYKNIKFYKGKASILKDRKLSKEQEDAVLQELIKNNDLQKGKYISYRIKDETIKVTFIELYNRYKSKFTENEFAKLLGISNENLRNIRRKDKEKLQNEERQVYKTKILMHINNTKEDKEKIYYEKIKKDPLCKEGRKINYEQLKEAYREYKALLTEYEFAYMLGIRQDYYYTMKENDEKRVYIRDYIILEKIQENSDNLQKEYYSLEEIEDICEKLQITKEQFIIYIVQNGKFYNPKPYLDSLQQNKGLWMRHMKMSNEFVEENYNQLLRKIKMLVKNICEKYEILYEKEELIEKSMEYMYTQCGDIERNFKDNEDEFNRMLYLRLRKYIRGESIYTKNNDKRLKSLYERRKWIEKEGLMIIERLPDIDLSIYHAKDKEQFSENLEEEEESR